MLCNICKAREARIFYTEIINGEKKEQYLCEECAARNTSLRLKAPFGGEPFSLGGLLSGLFEGEQERAHGREKSSEAVSAGAQPGTACPECGMTYEEFREHGQFGCAACYRNFGKLLTRNMKNIQGSDVHVGKWPKNAGERTEQPAEPAPELSETERIALQLDQAVEREEYELAASLRDRLRELKREKEKEREQEREREKEKGEVSR